MAWVVKVETMCQQIASLSDRHAATAATMLVWSRWLRNFYLDSIPKGGAVELHLRALSFFVLATSITWKYKTFTFYFDQIRKNGARSMS